MKINNIFTLNDWKFNEFTTVIVVIQLLMWVVGLLSLHSIHIPVFNDITASPSAHFSSHSSVASVPRIL